MNRDEARPYARALFLVARNRGRLEEYVHQLQGLAQLFRQNPELGDYLAHPGIPRREKKDLLQTVADLTPEIANLIFLLIDRGRTRLLPALIRHYRQQVEEYLGIVTATVTSVIPLTGGQRERLRVKLEQAMGVKVKLNNVLDPRVIGGLRVELKDKVIDGTLSSKLTEMEQLLTAPGPNNRGREGHGAEARRYQPHHPGTDRYLSGTPGNR